MSLLGGGMEKLHLYLPAKPIPTKFPDDEQ